MFYCTLQVCTRSMNGSKSTLCTNLHRQFQSNINYADIHDVYEDCFLIINKNRHPIENSLDVCLFYTIIVLFYNGKLLFCISILYSFSWFVTTRSNTCIMFFCFSGLCIAKSVSKNLLAVILLFIRNSIS